MTQALHELYAQYIDKGYELVRFPLGHHDENSVMVRVREHYMTFSRRYLEKGKELPNGWVCLDAEYMQAKLKVVPAGRFLLPRRTREIQTYPVPDWLKRDSWAAADTALAAGWLLESYYENGVCLGSSDTGYPVGDGKGGFLLSVLEVGKRAPDGRLCISTNYSVKQGDSQSVILATPPVTFGFGERDEKEA